MSRYIPPEGDRIQVAIAERARRRERDQLTRAIFAARRRRGLEARHAAKLRRGRGGDTTSKEGTT